MLRLAAAFIALLTAGCTGIPSATVGDEEALAALAGRDFRPTWSPHACDANQGKGVSAALVPHPLAVNPHATLIALAQAFGFEWAGPATLHGDEWSLPLANGAFTLSSDGGQLLVAWNDARAPFPVERAPGWARLNASLADIGLPAPTEFDTRGSRPGFLAGRLTWGEGTHEASWFDIEVGKRADGTVVPLSLWGHFAPVVEPGEDWPDNAALRVSVEEFLSCLSSTGEILSGAGDVRVSTHLASVGTAPVVRATTHRTTSDASCQEQEVAIVLDAVTRAVHSWHAECEA